MYSFIMAIHIFVSMVLIIVILMQAGRGSGVSEMFGGSSTQTIFGTSASNFLMKATAVCAVVFIVTCLLLAILSSKRSKSLMDGRIMPQSGTQAPLTGSETSNFPVQNENVPIIPAETAE